MALSVRPGRCLAITAHLFPWCLWALNNSYYSCYVQSAWLTLGSRWLCQLHHLLIYRYRHCLPVLPEWPLDSISRAIALHFGTSLFYNSFFSVLSSWRKSAFYLFGPRLSFCHINLYNEKQLNGFNSIMLHLDDRDPLAVEAKNLCFHFKVIFRFSKGFYV